MIFSKRWLCGAAYVLGACSQALDRPPLPLPDGGLESHQELADASAACEAGALTPCACATSDDGTRKTGVRRCTSTGVGTCECGDAATSDTPVDDCKAGSYAGDFTGTYVSDLTLLGLPATLHGNDAGAGPGALVFTLAAPTAQDGIFNVRDGKLTAQADNTFVLEGTFSGALNCASKTFSGELQGSYAVLGQRRVFTGPLTANYDAARASFVQGTWDAAENDGSGGPGNTASGKGSWGASFVEGAATFQASP